MARRKIKFSSDELARVLVEITGPVDWATLFGRPGPVELDVGCGKGLFLVQATSRDPELNMLGIEWSGRYARAAAERVLKAGVQERVKIARADARHLIAQYIPSQSVRAVHVYFPDPWWKKRHKKRRLFTPEFVAQVARVLQREGQLHIATDVAEYFEVIRNLVGSQREFVEIPPPPPPAGSTDLDYLTHFERKYRLEGRPIYRVSYRRA